MEQSLYDQLLLCVSARRNKNVHFGRRSFGTFALKPCLAHKVDPKLGCPFVGVSILVF